MKVYVGAMFSLKDTVKQYYKELQLMGIECTANWVREQAPPNTTLDQQTDRYLRHHAYQDLDDIDRANVMVLLTVDPKTPTPRGGRHTEAGYYLKCMRDNPKKYWGLVVVGPRENIFHYIRKVIQVDTWQEAKIVLKRLERDHTRKPTRPTLRTSLA